MEWIDAIRGFIMVGGMLLILALAAYWAFVDWMNEVNTDKGE